MALSEQRVRTLLQQDAERIVVTSKLQWRIDRRLRAHNSAPTRALALVTAAVVVVLVGIAASVIVGDSSSRPAGAPRVETPTLASLPVPPDVHITRPARGLPPELAAFSGTWVNVADGRVRLPIRIIVERIDSHSAQVVYVWGTLPDGSVNAGWQRFNADVLPGGSIAWGRGTRSAGRSGGCDAHGNACSVLRFALTMSTDRRTIFASRDIVGYPPFTVTLHRPGFHATQNLVVGVTALAIVALAALVVGARRMRTR